MKIKLNPADASDLPMKIGPHSMPVGPSKGLKIIPRATPPATTLSGSTPSTTATPPTTAPSAPFDIFGDVTVKGDKLSLNRPAAFKEVIRAIVENARTGGAVFPDGERATLYALLQFWGAPVTVLLPGGPDTQMNSEGQRLFRGWLYRNYKYDAVNDQFPAGTTFKLPFPAPASSTTEPPPKKPITEPPPKKPIGVLPFLLGGAGFFVGGPIGAAAGFGAGVMIGKQKATQPAVGRWVDVPDDLYAAGQAFWRKQLAK